MARHLDAGNVVRLVRFRLKGFRDADRGFDIELREELRPERVKQDHVVDHLQDRLDYEGKIDRSATNINWLLESGEAAAKAFRVEREAALSGTPGEKSVRP